MSSETYRARRKSHERKRSGFQAAFFHGCARIDAKHRKGCSPLDGAKRRKDDCSGSHPSSAGRTYGAGSAAPYRSAPFGMSVLRERRLFFQTRLLPKKQRPAFLLAANTIGVANSVFYCKSIIPAVIRYKFNSLDLTINHLNISVCLFRQTVFVFL